MRTEFYAADLAYIHAAGFGALASAAAVKIVGRLRASAALVHRVVDAGCGAGVLSGALIAAGFEVTGIDIPADFVAMARASVPRAEFIEASIHDAVFPACEAICAVGEVLSYGDAPIEAFLKKSAAALPAGGHLIFDAIETGEPSLSGRTWMSGADWAVMVESIETGTGLERRIETFRRVGEFYRRSMEVHRVRIFETAELTTTLERLGFRVETADAYGNYRLPARRRAFFCTKR